MGRNRVASLLCVAGTVGLIALLSPAQVAAEEPPSRPETSAKEIDATRAPQKPRLQAPPAEQPKAPPKAASSKRRNFEPTEKIQVDSVVSFPVDI